MKAAYFVHDLNDPAVHRRVRMLQAGGATVAVLGFCRGAPPPLVAGVAPVTIGSTENARLGQRAVAVLAGLRALPRWRRTLADADAIVARQLETLVLAVIARRVLAPGAPVIFECLDIHRLMHAPGPLGRLLRALEGRLLAQCQGLIVSSPDFIRAHFAPAHFARARRGQAALPVLLVENKVLATERDALASDALASDAPAAGLPARPPGPPWRIACCGVIRCARSLRLLADLAAALPGRVEVVIRGRVWQGIRPLLDRLVAATPGLSFAGPYDRHRDLAAIYGSVHFAWALDFYEDGGNSDWLLPNRLYEAALFGAIPIARAEVATGAWLARHGIGVLLRGDPAPALAAYFAGLDAARHAAAAQALAALPDGALVHTGADCAGLVRRLTAVRPAPRRAPAAPHTSPRHTA
jgi:succinoglycan biosynthesis protein ExoL